MQTELSNDDERGARVPWGAKDHRMSRRSKSARADPDAKNRTAARVPGSKPVAGAPLADTSVRNEIADALAQLSALEAEQADFRATFDRAKAASAADLQALQGRLDQAEYEKRDIAVALESTQNLHTEIVALRNAYATTAAEASVARDALAELQTQHAKAVQRIAALEQELADTLAQSQADRLTDARRADDHTQTLVETFEAKLQEANQRVAELSAQDEGARRELALAADTLASLNEQLAAAGEEIAQIRERARQAEARVETMDREIVARDGICTALRIENRHRQERIDAGVLANAMTEERLRSAEKRILEADHALALHELRRQAWHDSAIGRFSGRLLRMRKRWSALKSAFRGAKPNPLFDETFYLATNPDIAFSGKDPYRHYLDHGAREGRDPNPLFATAWYLKTNPDVAAAGVNPLVHFHETGAAQLRDPHPGFSVRAWRDAYPEAAAAGINPLQHAPRMNRDAS